MESGAFFCPLSVSTMLPILFEDNYLLVLDKPAGLQVEADRFGNPSLQVEVQVYFQKAFPWKKQLIVGIVHRLDRPVSGVVLIAKTPMALKEVNRQFEMRQVRKIYLAVVEGTLAEKESELVHWLKKDLENKRSVVGKADGKETKECRLKYRVLNEKSGKTLVEIELLTGRYHQIRAQFSALGNPIFGDEKYGSRHFVGKDQILLHAHRLTIRHPKSGEEMSFEAPAPIAFQL